MAIHPKIGLLGGALIGAVTGGLLLFLLGRITSGAQLTPVLTGVTIGIVVVASVSYGVWRSLPTSRRLEGLLHVGSAPSAEGYVSRRTRSELVGRTGVAISELRPVGTAEFDGERVDVSTEGDFVPAGTPVTVVEAEGMRLVVRPVRQVGSSSTSPPGS